MDTIQKHTVATVGYTLQTEAGIMVHQAKALSYLHGYNNILPGMEKALEGKKVGDVLRSTIAPADAFGEVIAQEPILVDRRDFGESFDQIYEGLGVNAQDEHGEKVILYVQSKQESYAVLSPNHPLAGAPLVFEATVLDIRCALDAEKEQGMVQVEQSSSS